jgi:hypothetical protein
MDHYGDQGYIRGPEETRELAYKVQSVGFGWNQLKVAEHYIQRAEQGLT